MKQSEAEGNEHPPIIVRFFDRDKRNEIFAKRLRPKSTSNLTSGRKTDFTIKENLTKFRKMLYKEARKAQLSTGYKFLWTWQGQILMRRNEMSQVCKVSSLRDLARIQNWHAGLTGGI